MSVGYFSAVNCPSAQGNGSWIKAEEPRVCYFANVPGLNNVIPTIEITER